MKIVSIVILTGILVLQSCAVSNAQTTNAVKIRREIEAIIPSLKSPWVSDSTNGPSQDRKFTYDDRVITFKVIADEYDVKRSRDMFEVFEKALSNKTNNLPADEATWAAGVIGRSSDTNKSTTAPENRIKYILWDVHPDWIVLQTFRGRDFQICGVHRTEPIVFAVRGNVEDFSLVSKALGKKLKKFPKLPP